MALLELARADAEIIAFLSYLVGILIAGGRVGWPEVGVALLVSMVSTNFIYTVNSIADWREDRIGHPRRPLPSGRLTPRAARAYAGCLLVAATLYPFAVAGSTASLLLLLLLPALGLAYSVKPLRLRRRPALAVVVVSIGLVTPLTVGAVMTSSTAEIAPVSAALLAFCLAVVPLKSLEEVREDAATGRPNLYERYGNRLFLWTGLGLAGMAAWSAHAVAGPMRWFLVVLAASAGACVGASFTWRDRSRLYRVVIRVVIAEGAALYLLLR